MLSGGQYQVGKVIAAVRCKNSLPEGTYPSADPSLLGPTA